MPTSNFKPSWWNQITTELTATLGVSIDVKPIKSKKIAGAIKFRDKPFPYLDALTELFHEQTATMEHGATPSYRPGDEVTDTTLDNSPGIPRACGKRPVDPAPSGVDSREKHNRINTKVEPAKAVIEALYAMELAPDDFWKAIVELNKEKHKALIFLVLRTKEKWTQVEDSVVATSIEEEEMAVVCYQVAAAVAIAAVNQEQVRSNPSGELSFDPEIEITARRSKALRNREVAACVLKNQKQMAEVAAADQPQERDYFVSQEEEVQTPLVISPQLYLSSHYGRSSVREARSYRGGFNNYSNWRPQQNNNWTNQQSSYQRSAQPPVFQNQPFRVKEEDWIKVGNVLASLDATVKDMQNQVAQMARKILERAASTLPSDTLENHKRREAHNTNQMAEMQHKEVLQLKKPKTAIIQLDYLTPARNKDRSSHLVQPNLTVVREFYSNLWGVDVDKIVVRGKSVDINRVAIREVLELLANIPPYEDMAFDMIDETPEGELPIALCEDATEDIWTIDSHGSLKNFPIAELKQTYKRWFKFICINLMPSNNRGVVTFDAAILLYAIAMNISIDATDVIGRQMHRYLNLRQKYWFFLILATRLMIRAGVHFLPGDERGDIPTPWSLQGPPDPYMNP
ncbi:OLC1v1036337C1 [Oldenlandia corymbosa var. corymbosa]|uniref:OLC1v1036337C1 n=1 Tax=Oldenlandia corymbosa var. corymbosa TaxID=529605 RepID=A0AAV1CXN1_OLDCO|nr:OLC1v1036337C1 [Oldenlandia corymbosa var. corymbosa]